ncbi:hyaluronan-binding protein 2 precursor [Danio rerio]|uniref:trypsin n=1 Tax=Danio rerio TaxID=7955 RepID=F1QW52_DANRE|nr:hyaluronan-binding protein 2 precursor [Danio rerio]|eukprot:NP_001103843.2 hyaluronan-binding protein 2 precursor [Danio rerio]
MVVDWASFSPGIMFPVILLILGLSGLTSHVKAAPGLLEDFIGIVDEIYDYVVSDTEEISSAEINETIDWLFSFFDEETCDPNPCQNNGVCKEKESGGFKCICPPPYIGKKCQNEKNVCKKVKCGNGDCVRIKKDPFYECKCWPPYRGSKCKNAYACNPSPCQNGGTCVKGRTRASFTCTCPEDYSGRFCQVGSNDCYEGNGESYRGNVSETIEEIECLPWNHNLIPYKEFEGNESIGEHNYCRNPDGDREPWCFVKEKGKLQWNYCNVKPCSETEPEKPLTTPTKLEFSDCGKAAFSMIAPRIFGGRKSLPEAHPWQASFQVRPKGSNATFEHNCGGTLIDSCWILTAAHCIDENDEVRVELGGVNLEKDDPDKQFVEVEKIIVHENYTETFDALYNDIALLKLKGRNGRCANESRSVRAACLPTDLFPEGTRCTISGYGATEKHHGVSTQLLDAKVLLISQSRCMSRNVYGNRMDDSMMCAGYMQGKIDSCQGDSGGPLVCKKDNIHYIYGVVSWGDSCGKKNKPGVYARVTKFIDWINEKMRTA